VKAYSKLRGHRRTLVRANRTLDSSTAVPCAKTSCDTAWPTTRVDEKSVRFLQLDYNYN